MWLQVCAVARVIACIINRQIMMALLSLGLNAQVLWEHYMQHVHDLNCLLEGSEGSLRVRPHASMYVGTVTATVVNLGQRCSDVFQLSQ